jgi:acyl carrier protein
MTGATPATVEPRVRRAVCDALGVSDEDLVREVSLVEDLAADSLDLLELAVSLESELGVTIGDRALLQVRTYGDLLSVVTERLGIPTGRTGADRAPQFQATIDSLGRRPALYRTGRLTAYAAQCLLEDARRAGRGAQLDVLLATGASADDAAWVEDQLAPLGDRGIDVHVRSVSPLGGAASPRSIATAWLGRR